MDDMSSMFRNEMRCLSNAVLQSCIRQELLATWGILPLVRKLVQDNAVPVHRVVKVDMHQCPRERGLVQHVLHLMLDDGQCFHREFQGSGFNAEHRTFTLYDRRRDGKVEHLHLVH